VVATESDGTIDSVQIYNNLCYKNEQSGISIVDYGAIDGPKKNITIMNNTCYKNGYQIYSKGTTGGGITIGSSLISSVIIRNNIVSKNNRWQIRSIASFDEDHNLIDGYRGESQEIKVGLNDVTGDPKFTNPDGNNFMLLANSPAIGAANPAFYAATDFAGISRPQGLNADIGAFEYIDLTGSINYKSNFSASVYPNPVGTRLTINIPKTSLFKNAEMRIYDMSGKEVKYISIKSEVTFADRGELKNGMYFYCIISNNEIIGDGKLVVQ